eukprot:scaffold22931_cov16-Tisochrysis_lutea.AAC.1
MHSAAAAAAAIAAATANRTRASPANLIPSKPAVKSSLFTESVKKASGAQSGGPRPTQGAGGGLLPSLVGMRLPALGGAPEGSVGQTGKAAEVREWPCSRYLSQARTLSVMFIIFALNGAPLNNTEQTGKAARLQKCMSGKAEVLEPGTCTCIHVHELCSG